MSASGKLKANTIIDDGSFGVSEYLATIESGDILDCEASFKFTPIE
ncbi:hypothetical protein LEY_23 [Paenibacillus phage Ley]|uniref:Uncharacterized protein n=3 Tax=Halcyonevirus C7Cdelta TaxID=2845733 RepID=A0A345ASI0_9CAUD|nr:hypothetical protein KMD17_gp23 [Paenibacillus phage C7Cdelta]AXF39784.1 hypothetical protein C7CDELTA_23 [Paenibacillus phage C7Cdelta]AXF39950.1 hypothetical protein ASH_23 [Paenibacillus phage Ash]AXF40237.1 hypothetical protein LEY_23 [Paenibacillus phage Ley]